VRFSKGFLGSRGFCFSEACQTEGLQLDIGCGIVDEPLRHNLTGQRRQQKALIARSGGTVNTLQIGQMVEDWQSVRCLADWAQTGSFEHSLPSSSAVRKCRSIFLPASTKPPSVPSASGVPV
jgi:hypothetical protein